MGENPEFDGNFTKLRFALSRQQVITDTHSLFAAFSGQIAGQALDSSERFFLGGANGVRAYPSSEAGGSTGQLANVELRWRLPESFVLTGFYDWGRVENPSLPSFILKGAGLSLAWQTPIGLSLKATWAHRIGDNPNPTASGNDQDGSLVKNRWWLNALIPF